MNPRFPLSRTIVGLFLLGAMGDHAASQSAQAVPEWAQDQTKKWYDAFNAGDAAAIVKLYAADAVLLLQGQTYAGRAAIEAFHTGNFQKGRFSCTWTIGAINIVDKLAAVSGDDSCVETPKPAGASVSWKGRWLMVYQRQPDGSWLIVRDSGEETRPSRGRLAARAGSDASRFRPQPEVAVP